METNKVKNNCTFKCVIIQHTKVEEAWAIFKNSIDWTMTPTLFFSTHLMNGKGKYN